MNVLVSWLLGLLKIEENIGEKNKTGEIQEDINNLRRQKLLS